MPICQWFSEINSKSYDIGEKKVLKNIGRFGITFEDVSRIIKQHRSKDSLWI